MKCAWESLLAILPPRLRQEVDKQSRDTLQELRLRLGCPVELVCSDRTILFDTASTREDIRFVVNTASRYSPWSSQSISFGYITAQGGHRIGLCGSCVVQAGVVTGIREVTSLCIRVARCFENIGANAPISGSLLILGPPGSGKTTLLRDLIRLRSVSGSAVSVVDERGELFPSAVSFDAGPRTDILSGCSKAQGVDMALRTMSPKCIAVDEITAAEDCQALLSAGWCGVDLLATAHATNCIDLCRRQIYRPLAQSHLFTHALVLSRNQSWRMERMEQC